MQRGGESAGIGLDSEVLFLRGFVQRRRGCPCAVTVDQRGKQPAVDIARDGDVIRLWQEVTDRFVPVPVAFDLVPMLVEPSAAIAVGKYIGIMILE